MTIWSMKASIPRRIREARSPTPTERAVRRPARICTGPRGYARRDDAARPPRTVPCETDDHPPGPHHAPDAAGAKDVVLTGADLTIDDVEAVARGGTPAHLDVHARARMDEARAVVERLVAAGEVVYGITTGFGDLATTYIPRGRRTAAPGEPAGEPRGGRWRATASGRGPRDAAAPGQHACARPLRLPAGARRPAPRVPRCGHSPGRAGRRGASGRRATSRRSRISRCRSSGAARSRWAAR